MTVVAIARVVGRACRFLDPGGRFGGMQDCRRLVFLSARGNGRWRFARRGVFPGGDYLVRVRSVDAVGGMELPGTRANQIRFRIR